MDSPRGIRPKHHGESFVMNSGTLLVLRFPDSQHLRVASRSVFLAAFLLALPFIGSVFRVYPCFHQPEPASGSVNVNFNTLGFLVQDLVETGLLKKGVKALIVSPAVEGFGTSPLSKELDIDLVLASKLEPQHLFSHQNFDFVFFSGHVDTQLVGSAVKMDGVVAAQMSTNPSNVLPQHADYRVVHLRQFGATVVVMSKTILADALENSSRKKMPRKLASAAKKAALNELEDAVLEPSMAKSSEFMKKIKYLPELLDDSLAGYSRRVFINVGLKDEKDGVMEWFHNHYPRRNQYFETYNFLVVSEAAKDNETPPVDVSGWLLENVKVEEYVVMKAEADLVEEMLERSAISLVDELFLECDNQWQHDGKSKSRRAYWECLALYGRLKDEGVAVHQWWD